MAESYLEVTAGSGTKLWTNQRTVGANTVEQQLIGLGEPYLATYTVTTASISIATANAHLLQIMAGGSLPVYVRRIRVDQSVAVTTGAIATWELYRLTTAGTGGTAITPAPLDSTDSASGAAGMSLPSSKGTEGTKILSGTAHTIQTIGAGGSGIDTTLLSLDFESLRSKALRIPAGTANGIALKWVSASTGGSAIVTAEIVEATY